MLLLLLLLLIFSSHLTQIQPAGLENTDCLIPKEPIDQKTWMKKNEHDKELQMLYELPTETEEIHGILLPDEHAKSSSLLLEGELEYRVEITISTNTNFILQKALSKWPEVNPQYRVKITEGFRDLLVTTKTNKYGGFTAKIKKGLIRDNKLHIRFIMPGEKIEAKPEAIFSFSRSAELNIFRLATGKRFEGHYFSNAQYDSGNKTYVWIGTGMSRITETKVDLIVSLNSECHAKKNEAASHKNLALKVEKMETEIETLTKRSEALEEEVRKMKGTNKV